MFSQRGYRLSLDGGVSPIILYVGIYNSVSVFEGKQCAVVSPGHSEEKGSKNSGSDLIWQFDLKH